MKKTLLIFVLVLAGVFAVLSVMGRHSDYVAQAVLGKINQRFRSASQDPKHIPDVYFRKILSEYDTFLKKFPNFKGNFVVYIQKGRVFNFLKEYDKARAVFEEMVEHYRDQPDIAVLGVEEVGRTYALEGNREKTLQIYERVLNGYPLTQAGLKTPLLMVEYYIKEKRSTDAAVALKRAIDHYNMIIAQQPGTVTSFEAFNALAMCYQTGKQWSSAIDAYQHMIFDYINHPFLTPKILDSVVKTINVISVAQLNDYGRPIGIYQKFINEHPRHPFNLFFQQMIKDLTLLQESNVKLKTSNQ